MDYTVQTKTERLKYIHLNKFRHTLISTASNCLPRPLSPGPPPTVVCFILVRRRDCMFCNMVRDWSTPLLVGVSFWLRSHSYMEGILGTGGGSGACGVGGSVGSGGGGGGTIPEGVPLSVQRETKH